MTAVVIPSVHIVEVVLAGLEEDLEWLLRRRVLDDPGVVVRAADVGERPAAKATVMLGRTGYGNAKGHGRNPGVRSEMTA